MSKSKSPPRMATLIQELRWYLRHAEVTPVEISRQIGIHHSSLYRFLLGTRGLSDATMDRLARHLNLRLVRDCK